MDEIVAVARAQGGARTVLGRWRPIPNLMSKSPAARHAAEQLYLDILLDGLDEAAERRLLNAKPLRRAGDVPFFGDGDDVAEMPQFHCHTSKV
jgi:hypothetical protein